MQRIGVEIGADHRKFLLIRLRVSLTGLEIHACGARLF